MTNTFVFVLCGWISVYYVESSSLKDFWKKYELVGDKYLCLRIMWVDIGLFNRHNMLNQVLWRFSGENKSWQENFSTNWSWTVLPSVILTLIIVKSSSLKGVIYISWIMTQGARNPNASIAIQLTLHCSSFVTSPTQLENTSKDFKVSFIQL